MTIGRGDAGRRELIVTAARILLTAGAVLGPSPAVDRTRRGSDAASTGIGAGRRCARGMRAWDARGGCPRCDRCAMAWTAKRRIGA